MPVLYCGFHSHSFCVVLQAIILRSCLLSKIEGIQEQNKLEKLELYDNHIEVIENISHLHNLKVLDLSFNAIREMVNLSECCPLLEEVYIAQNKLRTIQGLQGLVHLRILDLGANRIRVSHARSCSGLRFPPCCLRRWHI
jgi:protein phosphatase 1 regulatory subunit 7